MMNSSETPNNHRVVLIGFMGSGKSAVGRRLASLLDWHYLDTDAEIERVAGRTIAELFADEGEAAFRVRETALLIALTRQNVGGTGGTVFSTGGGTPLRPENAPLLKGLGTVVWLKASVEASLARLGPDVRSRPLLAGAIDNPHPLIQSLLAAREPRYAALADYTLDTSDSSGPDDAAEQLRDMLARRIE